MKDFVPVEVTYKKNKENWYLDVSKLSLGDLLNLRKELLGTNEDSIRVIDGIIYDDKITTKLEYVNVKSQRHIKKERKEQKQKMRTKVKKRR